MCDHGALATERPRLARHRHTTRRTSNEASSDCRRFEQHGVVDLPQQDLMATYAQSSPCERANPARLGHRHPGASPGSSGEDLFDTIVWDRAALDKFRRHFLPKDTIGPPTYQVNEEVVLGELRRLAVREPLTFTTRPPAWVRTDSKATGYATLGDWCIFALGLRDRGQSDKRRQTSATHKPYAAIATIAPIGREHDWRQIDVNALSGRVLAYAVLLTRDAAPAYARAAGMHTTTSLDMVRAHFFDTVADHGRMVRETPSWVTGWKRPVEGFLMLDDLSAVAICRQSPARTRLKRPYPFRAVAYLTPRH